MGRIGAAHGIKGEVRIQSFTEDPLALVSYGLMATNKPGLTIRILSARTTTNVLVARIEGVNDRNAAEKLNGVELYVDRALLPEVEDEDDFYHADLLGLRVQLADGTSLGTVSAIPNFGAGDILEVISSSIRRSRRTRAKKNPIELFSFDHHAVPRTVSRAARRLGDRAGDGGWAVELVHHATARLRHRPAPDGGRYAIGRRRRDGAEARYSRQSH
jgi:16S rRNA processing protein RimM